DDVTAAVQELLSLKNQYKTLTGSEYKPSNASAQKENKKPADAAAAAATTTSSTTVTSAEADKLLEKITQQGDKVRELKTNKSAPKVSSKLIRLISEK
ncbi:unnamed protein product, partial [Adineta steineri]